MRGTTLKHRRSAKVDAESTVQNAHGGRFFEEGWDRYERECDEWTREH